MEKKIFPKLNSYCCYYIYSCNM